MGRGLTRSVSRASREERKRLRSRTRSAGGELIETVDTFEEEDRNESIDEPSVVEKYKASARIVNSVLLEIVSAVQDGASACKLCRQGDQSIANQTDELYRRRDKDGRQIERGIAFPTCVNVNEVVCHFSPLESEPDIIIKAGDVVRVELGAHIDGYIATAAHTVVVPGGPEPTDSKRDDVIGAAYLAAEGAMRLMKPGKTTDDVSEYIRTVAYSLGVQSCQGILSHRMARFEEQGHQVILQKPVVAADDSHQLAQTFEFVENSVWALDICMVSDGEDRLRQLSNYSTTIFKRSEVVQLMKIKAANYVLRELRARGRTGSLPFALYWFDDQLQARFGLASLKQNQLVDSFPVLCAKPGQTVARFKYTVLITQNRVEQITGLPLPDDFVLPRERLHPDAAVVLKQALAFEGKTAKRKALRAKRRRLESAQASTVVVE
eukprot:TRINITY_DN2135_c0_g1_i1.p1 TRINITY_DN2135_c0_g1~~TRINITY_DN2135_c0_g1_i1.p1  ORF type:complete len:443 (+),score=93.99 TRINITY_DN2135_c0_g1_i1:24-1331(+)